MFALQVLHLRCGRGFLCIRLRPVSSSRGLPPTVLWVETQGAYHCVDLGIWSRFPDHHFAYIDVAPEGFKGIGCRAGRDCIGIVELICTNSISTVFNPPASKPSNAPALKRPGRRALKRPGTQTPRPSNAPAAEPSSAPALKCPSP
jgi:hypothetical protein